MPHRFVAERAIRSGQQHIQHDPEQGLAAFRQRRLHLRLAKQVFTNKDGSTSILYLASSDLLLDYDRITAIYQKVRNISL